MARPQKNNADFFSHDAGMRDDEKIKAVRRKFKHEGYSVWNMTLEKLCNSENFQFVFDNESVELMAGDFDIDPDLLKEIILYFIKLKLLVVENGVVYSQTMKTRFESLLSKRKRDRGELSTAETPESEVIVSESTHSIVKNSIEHNSTEQHSTELKGKRAIVGDEDDLPF